jgi:hypothetical protein
MRFCSSRARLSAALCALTLAAAAAAPSLAETSQPASVEQSGLEPLVIVDASGRHVFQVEVMRTQAQLEKGLMFRKFMPSDRGMLFDFKTAQPVMMWMKNTYISLDMIFMSRKGLVTHIARDAEPLSETIIPSDGPAYAVLEVNADVARQIGLKVGDQVQNEIFRR